MTGPQPDAIGTFNATQTEPDRAICETLRQTIDEHLPDAESRIWHAYPVWFLTGNPVVGYSKLKHCIRLLFWNGRSFATPGMRPEGKFKAAELRFTDAAQIDREALAAWLAESREIQWDYRNIARRRGRLERLS